MIHLGDSVTFTKIDLRPDLIKVSICTIFYNWERVCSVGINTIFNISFIVTLVQESQGKSIFADRGACTLCDPWHFDISTPPLLHLSFHSDHLVPPLSVRTYISFLMSVFSSLKMLIIFYGACVFLHPSLMSSPLLPYPPYSLRPLLLVLFLLGTLLSRVLLHALSDGLVVFGNVVEEPAQALLDGLVNLLAIT